MAMRREMRTVTFIGGWLCATAEKDAFLFVTGSFTIKYKE